MSEHESLHQSDQTPLALAECSFLTEGKKTSSKLNLSGSVLVPRKAGVYRDPI